MEKDKLSMGHLTNWERANMTEDYLSGQWPIGKGPNARERNGRGRSGITSDEASMPLLGEFRKNLYFCQKPGFFFFF